MRLRVNKQARILEVDRESADDEEFSLLKGFNFISLIDESQTTAANNFIRSIFESNEVQLCRLELKIRLDANTEYLCVGIPGNDEECTLVARKVFDIDKERKWIANSQARLRNLFNRMPVALALIDTSGQFKAVNPSIEKLFGYSAQELAGMNLKEIIIAAENEKALVDRIKASHEHNVALKGVKRGGETIHIELSGRSIDENAELINVFIFDVSQRVRLEQLKQEFVQMISHDLKTPLSSISLFLERVGLGKYTDRQPEDLMSKANAIHEDTVRLMRLIDSLLTLDKLDEGFAKPDKKAVSLADVIEISINGVIDLADSKGIVIDEQYDELTVSIDRDQIVQVLINLLNNAIKYSPCDTHVAILTKRLEGDQIEIRVKDQGPGIQTELRDSLFDRFARLRPGLASDGTGLGLAICKAIVEAHGGTIGLNSTLGAGSEFWVRVPI
ncbi:MAG: PAS domain-containing sensor histidine kinase [Candidatus Obscuribacterales bacterium]|nr:PAS domain-containing sensor histidine kinase [Candidatus Obscuribacterales bacterium]